jgi:hypothetical protein
MHRRCQTSNRPRPLRVLSSSAGHSTISVRPSDSHARPSSIVSPGSRGPRRRTTSEAPGAWRDRPIERLGALTSSAANGRKSGKVRLRAWSCAILRRKRDPLPNSEIVGIEPFAQVCHGRE